MTGVIQKDFSNGLLNIELVQESDDIEKKKVENILKLVNDKQTSRVIPLLKDNNQTNLQKEVERQVPINMTIEQMIKPPTDPSNSRQCQQTEEIQIKADKIHSRGRQYTRSNGPGKQRNIAEAFSAHCLSGNDAGEMAKLTETAQMEANKTLEEVYQDLESAKGLLVSQVIQLSSNVPPVTPYIPRVQRPTQEQTLETIRSRSLDTRAGSSFPFSQGSRTWSLKSGREKSLEDIDKDIEIIWKELQELDSLPTSRCSSRINHSMDKSNNSGWIQPDAQSPSSSLPLSEQSFVIPSWRSTTTPSYSQLSRPSSRQSISSKSSWRSTLNSSYKNTSYQGTPMSRHKEPSLSPKTIWNVQNTPPSTNQSLDNKSNTPEKIQQVYKQSRDKSPISCFEDDKSINIPANHYMVPAHTYNNYSFVPRSILINPGSIISNNNSQPGKKGYKEFVEKTGNSPTVAATSTRPIMNDDSYSLSTKCPMAATEIEDSSDLIVSSPATVTVTESENEDNTDIFTKIGHLAITENAATVRKEDNNEFNFKSGTLPAKVNQTTIREEGENKPIEKEHSSDQLMKNYVSATSLSFSSFKKESKNEFPSKEDSIGETKTSSIPITIKENNSYGIMTNGALSSTEEKKEASCEQGVTPFNSATKISIPIMETGFPFIKEEDSQSNLKSCLKTDKTQHQDSWTNLIRTRSKSPAGRSSPSKLNVNFIKDATVQEYESKDHEHRLDYPHFQKIQRTERKSNVSKSQHWNSNGGAAIQPENIEKEVIQHKEDVMDIKKKAIINGQENKTLAQNVTIKEIQKKNKSKEKTKPVQQKGSPVVPKRNKGKGQNSPYKQRKNAKRISDSGINILNDVSTQTEKHKKKGACSLM